MKYHADVVKYTRPSGGPSTKKFVWIEVIDGILYLYKKETDPVPIVIINGNFEINFTDV